MQGSEVAAGAAGPQRPAGLRLDDRPAVTLESSCVCDSDVVACNGPGRAHDGLFALRFNTQKIDIYSLCFRVVSQCCCMKRPVLQCVSLKIKEQGLKH